jgi:type IV pilus assembly protein PilO
MSSKMKQWVALTAVGVLAVVAAGWFLLISPKRGEAADVRAQVTSQEQTNSGLQMQLATLKAQQKTLPAQQAKLATVAAKIPDNPALPALIRALSAAADDAGVELVSMSPGSPSPVAAAAPAGLGTGTSTGAAGAKTGSGAQTLSSAGSASGYSAGVLTAIPLSLNVVGGYFQVEQFFDRLENLTRAAKVSGFSLAPGANPLKKDATGGAVDTGKTLNATITANVYMAVGRGAAASATVPAK